MKFLLICFVALPAALASLSPDTDDYLHGIEQECNEETGLGYTRIEIIRNNKAVPNERRASEWAKCMMLKHNVIRYDGAVNPFRYIRIPHDTNLLIEAYRFCKYRNEIEIADVARQMMNCYMNYSDGLVMATTPLINTRIPIKDSFSESKSFSVKGTSSQTASFSVKGK